jgi:hypothetical protein
MTLIIGQRGRNFSALAADTRRRDHVTGDLRRVHKIHRLSDRILLAQGGAGTGAADDVVSALKADRDVASMTVTGCVRLVSKVAPEIMARAEGNWAKHGRTIPPTFLILASVDVRTKQGFHKSISLTDGTQKTFKDDGPYFAGTNTPLICEVASNEWARRMAADPTSLAFDDFTTTVTETVSAQAPQDIGLPVDVGVVRLVKGQFQCTLSEEIDSDTPADPAFNIKL